MTSANYSIINRYLSKYRWSLLFSGCAHEHVYGTNTHAFPEGKVPNYSHIAFTVQLNWSLLPYGKQRGQRSAQKPLPIPGKK